MRNKKRKAARPENTKNLLSSLFPPEGKCIFAYGFAKRIVRGYLQSALIMLASMVIVFFGFILITHADFLKDDGWMGSAKAAASVTPKTLAAVTPPAKTLASSGTGSTATYTYDNEGARMTKTENGKTTYYINKYYEEDSDGTVRKFIWAGDVKVATVESMKGSSAPEKVTYHHSDHLGGSNVSTDSAGSVAEMNDYFPYGKSRIEERTGTYTNNYLYTGKELDRNTGLYYYGVRYYDPLIGRFTSVDPWQGDLRNPQTLNSYSYTLNNPMRYTDPTGMYEEDVHLNLTIFLAEQAGFSLINAFAIGLYNQLVDTTPSTEPGLNMENYITGTTEKYHFANYTDAVNNVKNAINGQNLISFGAALHTFQDTYSHNITPIEHIIASALEKAGFKGADPDKTQNKPREAKLMAYNTYIYMREYLKKGITDEKELAKFNTETESKWSGMVNTIESFINSEDANKIELLEKDTVKNEK